jgi:hypothetical protein
MAAKLGEHDPATGQLRRDGLPDDGTGSLYGVLGLLLPGFGTFRYPSKLFPFASAGIAVLAASGWDRVTRGARKETRRLRRLGLAGLGLSLAGLVGALAARGQIVGFLTDRVPADPMFGPVDVAGAWKETQFALVQGAMVFGTVVLVAHRAHRHPRSTGALAILLLTVDLGLANSRLVWTIPQAAYDAPSEVARLIEASERSNPFPGPFRIHRMTGSFPPQLFRADDADGLTKMITWARGTLHPLHALPLGLEYCITTGALKLDDHAALFHPQVMALPAETASALGARAGQEVVYFPRRCFDIWGARYFILPARPDWASLGRGYAAFLNKTDLIYPSPDVLYERPSRKNQEPWGLRQDWQLRRNQAAYPRSWIVHYAQVRPSGSDQEARALILRSIAFMNDPIWTEKDRPVLDLRQAALLETDDTSALEGFISRSAVEPTESVAVVKQDPQRVELTASLARPGLVILSDTYYPGWRLTIDGRTSPIFRANRLMRAACVPAGDHTLVFTYDPMSFRIGAAISVGGLMGIVVLAWRSRRITGDIAFEQSSTHSCPARPVEPVV